MDYNSEQDAVEALFESYNGSGTASAAEYIKTLHETSEARRTKKGFPDCRCVLCNVLRSNLDEKTKNLMLGMFAFGRQSGLADVIRCCESIQIYPTQTTDSDIGGLLAALEVDQNLYSLEFALAVQNFSDEEKQVLVLNVDNDTE